MKMEEGERPKTEDQNRRRNTVHGTRKTEDGKRRKGIRKLGRIEIRGWGLGPNGCNAMSGKMPIVSLWTQVN